MSIFDLPPLPLNEELTTILAEKENIRIERIVSTGQTTGWYDQDQSEFVVLLDGNATIEFEEFKTISNDTDKNTDNDTSNDTSNDTGNNTGNNTGNEKAKHVSLTKGSALMIQPHEKHRVSYTSSDPPCVWLCVFF